MIGIQAKTPRTPLYPCVKALNATACERCSETCEPTFAFATRRCPVSLNLGKVTRFS